MKADRTIRAMTKEEKQAKRDWGTSACQARNCTRRAAYLVREMSRSDEWWQYLCPRHAKSFAEEHGLEMPPGASRNARVARAQ